MVTGGNAGACCCTHLTFGKLHRQLGMCLDSRDSQIPNKRYLDLKKKHLKAYWDFLKGNIGPYLKIVPVKSEGSPK